MIKLYAVNSSDCEFLYDLLKKRPDYVNISHAEMPTFEKHCEFVENHYYVIWNIIYRETKKIGSIYLTCHKEIGVSLIPEEQGKGYGKEAVKLLMKEAGYDFYFANIAPKNKDSQAFFEKMGFKHIQNTYKLKAE